MNDLLDILIGMELKHHFDVLIQGLLMFSSSLGCKNNYVPKPKLRCISEISIRAVLIGYSKDYIM